MPLTELPRAARWFRFSRLLPAALACCLAFSAFAAAPSKKPFDVPAGLAEESLKRFSAQSGLEVLFVSDRVANVRTNAVKGDFTPREAIDLLLADTDLAAAQDDKTGAVRVRRNISPNVPRVAQTTPGSRRSRENPEAGTSTVPADTQAITLSPFEVQAEQDTGYAASGTLMGTRLRTDLKDIASSISAVTKEFMQDINAHDLEGLLVYTTGTEVGGVGGNFSAAVDSGQRTIDFDAGTQGATSATRIRGLGSADNTRDYFLSSVPIDGYIVDRMEISRGPNSMLYGLGAPAGIINANLKRADTRRTRTNVSQQFGSYGTSRTTFDHNQLLLRDKLAVRVASLYGDRRFRIEDTFSRDERAYGTVTYTPTRSTIVKANFELGLTRFNRPRNAPPYDNFSYWWRTGKQVYDPTTNTVTSLVPRDTSIPSLTFNMTQFGDVAFRHMVVYPDPNSATPGIAVAGNPIVMANRADRSRANPAGGVPLEAALGALGSGVNFRRALVPTSDPGRNFYRWLVVTDPNIFDYYHYQLDGPNGGGKTEWKTFNASIEQRFFKDKLGTEAAYAYETLDHVARQTSTSQEYNIFVDSNQKLLNGGANPNFGRPLTAARGSQSQNDTDRESKRLTAYQEVDLRRAGPVWLGKILGRHTFTGAYSDQRSFRFSRSGPLMTLTPEYELFHSASIGGKSSPTRGIARASYLGSSLMNLTGPEQVRLQPITTAQVLPNGAFVPFLTTSIPATNATAPNPWIVRNAAVAAVGDESVDAVVSNASRARQKVQSQVVVASNRWFENNIVTTFGWRRDKWKNYQSDPAVVDPNTGLVRASDRDLPAVFALAGAREDHSNYGIAVHAPEFIRRRLPLNAEVSLYASQADNFQVTSQRYNVYNEPIDSPSGKTKEYGIRLALFKGKFEVRATHYESGAVLAVDTNTGATIGQINDRMEGIIEQMYTPGGYYHERWSNPANPDHAQYLAAKNALDAWITSPGGNQYLNTFGYRITTAADGNKVVDGRDNRSSEVVNTTDTVSKGWEFEAVFNPTRSWQLAVNGAQQSAMRFNSSKEIQRLIAAVFDPLWTGPLRNVRGTVNPAQSWYDNLVGTVYLGPNRARVLDGTLSPEIRKWRWNAVTRYSFREGLLRGWSIGGSVRWEDKVSIGYPYVNSPDAGPVLDVTRPHWGASETSFDAFVRYNRRFGKRYNWTAQVHFRNIGIGNEIIPTYANPDGSYSSFRIREAQNWSISNSLEF